MGKDTGQRDCGPRNSEGHIRWVWLGWRVMKTPYRAKVVVIFVRISASFRGGIKSGRSTFPTFIHPPPRVHMFDLVVSSAKSCHLYIR